MNIKTLNTTFYRSLRPIINESIGQALSECTLPTDRTLLRQVRRHARAGAYLATLAMVYRTNEEKAQTEALRIQSITDPVTGLDNRRGYDSNIRQSFTLAREKQLPVAVVSLDLNDMGKINQAEGLEEGNRWIRTAADILNRSTDPRPARWGGDEYAVVLPGASQQEVTEWWDGIHPQFDEAGIRVSAGAAICRPFTLDLDEAITVTQQAAEVTMQQAKQYAKPLDISAMLICDSVIAGGQ